jgi:hypothetical protein
LKVKPPTLVLTAEKAREVVLEVPKNAVPVGTAAGLQLPAVSKSFEPGFCSQVAFCAAAGGGAMALSSAAAHSTTAIAVVDVSTARLRRTLRKEGSSRQSAAAIPAPCSLAGT